MTSALVEKAALLALQAHEGQVRKHDSSPYIVHPVSVALILSRHGFSDTVIAAGLTHDVLEDTSVGEEVLQEALGEEVVAIVKALSEDKTLPWEERKERYIQSVGRESESVKAVSVADKLHNLSNMLEGEKKEGEAFWNHFNRGREAQAQFHTHFLKTLEDNWQHPLLAEYRTLVERFARS